MNEIDIATRFSRLDASKRKQFLGVLLAEGIDFADLPIVPAAAADRHAVSYAQQRQWFLWELERGSTAYHVSGALQLSGPLDVAALEHGFASLVARHESLRTVFRANEEGLAEQWVQADVRLTIDTVDLSGVADVDRAQRVQQAAAAINATPFDLTAGPLLRVGLIRTAAQSHVLVVVMHHIVSDGWSMQVIVDEFAAAYVARLQGRTFAPAALPIQYADYAVWQRHWLDAGESHRQLAYWKAQLGDTQPILQLPTDRPRRADGRYRAAQHGIVVSKGLVQGLQKRAQALGGTLFMVLLAGYQVLLNRYSGQADVRVGVPIANRQRSETERVVGFFVNTQVLRGQLTGAMTLGDVLAQTKETALGAQAHQDLPFEQLVEALQPERHVGVNPLFQVVFNHQRADHRALQGVDGLTMERYALGEQGAQFELTLNTAEVADGGVQVNFTYAKELFDAETIARMAGHYEAVLQALADRPQQMVADVALLGEKERLQIAQWGEHARRRGCAGTIHALIEQQAAMRPHAQAVGHEGHTLSYGELNARANRLAHRLIRLGVTPESKVGLAVERSIDMVVGLLAILKAGGAYVPLDPSYPGDRLAYMVDDSGVALVLTQSGVQMGGTLPTLELDTLDLGAEPDVNPQVPVQGENLAYVIYTSGSTGRPKGAQLCHRNVTRLLGATDPWFSFGPDDVWTMFHSYAFDFSVWEIFGALCTGGKLVVVPYWVSRSPEDFLQLLRTEQVTVLNQTPSAFGQLMRVPGLDQGGLALRYVVFGGEALEPQALRPWIDRFGDAMPQLINMYGITETTVHVTYRPITRADLGGQRSPVGAAIPDLGLRVLNAALNPVPIGIAGELHVAGEGLARGYLNRAALSAERFIADPFGDAGERLYRTGDLVRWTARGELEYLGRIDHQVKVRGFRIELGEIEAQLLVQPEVSETVVIAQEAAAGTRLVAYVALQQPVDVPTLRERLGQVLPDHMVPSAIVVLDTLPLNANGKVDRKALPEPEHHRTGEHEAPEGEAETALATIWSELLGHAPVGRADNFFELGGDSILSLKLVAQARKRGLNLTPRQVFEHQTLRAQALAARAQVAQVAIPLLSAADRARPLPLSHAQARQWFLWQLDKNSTAYHIAGALSLTGPLDVAAVSHSFAALVQRHESLRTVFRAGPGGLAEQVILPAAELVVEEVDLSAEHSGRADAVGQAVARFNAQPFDLTKGPLLRVGLVRESDRSHVLVVVMHHIVSDGWSMQVIVDEFVALYQARLDPAAFPLPHLPAQYADYAAWQRQWLDAGETDRQLAYWKQHLGSSHPVLQVPADHVRRADGQYRVAHREVQLAPALVQGLQAQARAQGGTLFMALLAAYQVLLCRYSGQEDVRIGVPIANRQRAETEGIVGFFVNTQVLRGEVTGRMALADVLAQARAAALGAQENQDVPFEHLVQTLQPERQLGVNPLFQVAFNHQRSDERALQRLDGLAIARYPLGDQAAQFELTLNTLERSDGSVQVTLSHAKELFDASTIERMLGHYVAVLQALVQRPQLRLADVELAGAAERQQVAAWGRHVSQREAHEPVHRLIERQAAQRPRAAAVAFQNEVLTYAELNLQANRLAHRLIALGVKPETKVGLAVERSVGMVVGLLAILKAGGAYVPLDPSYPGDRLAYMADDSGVALVLTQSGVQMGGTLPTLELDTLDLGAEPDVNPQVPVQGENLAYVIYTSGSTGRPKGAQLCHRNVTRLLSATDPWFSFGPGDVWTMFHSYAFDFSVWEIFGALCTGGKLVVVPYWVSRSPEDFLQLLRTEQVTVLNQTPSAFVQLTRVPGAIEGGLALRCVVFGGEALEPQALRPWIDRFGDAMPQLINMYGITETTVHVTYRPITRADLGGQRSPVGAAIPDLGLRVLDAALNPVPIGIAGELHVAGAGLARGYLNRPGLTAERFIADPFGDASARLYRTGDLVRWNAHGGLEYLGRIDHQVKVRGFRIELGEIEAQLLAQPDVREAVVLAREGERGTRLVGYVALQQATGMADLRDRLGQVLPEYMVPSAIVVLDTLPLNANGKVDRKALPDAEHGSAREYEAPRGGVETAVAAIWAEVLGVPRVGRTDDFFELGGHSLLALRLLEGLRSAGWQTPVRTLFQNPRLASFAAAMANETGRAGVQVPPNGIPAVCESIQPDMLTLVALDAAQIRRIEAAVPGGAVNIQDIYPLAPLQEGMLFHHLLQGEHDAYVTSHTLRFDTQARLTQFIDSFNQVIARHDTLRTAVMWEGLDEPVQVVHRHALLRVDWHATQAGSRIDVRQAPMVRAVASLDDTTGRWVLHLQSHHLIEDHTTLKLLVGEISLLQQGRGAELGRAAPFRDYVAQARLGVSREEHEGFFRPMLADVDEPTAPDGLLDVQGDGSAIDEARVALPPALAARVRQQAQRSGVTAAAVFHLAWAMVLSKRTGRDDVVFGTVLFGRMQGGADATRAMGLFINTLPLRVKLGALDVASALQRTHEALSDLLHHEHASLSLAQRCSGLPGGTPLFSALLNYRHRAVEAPDAHAWDGIESLASTERTNYPFWMSVDDLGDGFGLVAQVVRSVAAQRVCVDMLAAVEAIVDALAAPTRRALADIDLLGGDERQQLAAWSSNPVDSGDAELVHQVIERQAAATPDAPAVVFGDTRLSYAELNGRANRLAHRLIGLGVAPETPVGIAVERSVEMVVGLLAILKAGGAYVPLDPSHPRDRLAAMVEDSGMALLLTQPSVVPKVPASASLRTLLLDTLDLAGESTANPRVAVHAQHLAYVLYTSGSTGRPKGVAMRHGPVAELVRWHRQEFGSGQRTLLFASPCFDVAFQEVACGLDGGGGLVQTTETQRHDVAALLSVMRDGGVERLFIPFAVLQHLAEAAVSLGVTLPQLQQVITAGEQLKVTPAIRQWLAAHPACALVNQYGPTETHVVSHFSVRQAADADLPPIGTPVSGTELAVLDPGLQRCAAGVPGELYLGGLSLARGYLNRPALSAERFIADPFGAAGDRLYRTGDLVRWNPQGELEYLGRIDHQVKVRGFRVELGEIEAQLLAQPEVREAVVVAQDGPAGPRLAAYVALQQAIAPAELRLRLSARLPEYMVPSAVAVLDALPLNANGKVDRKALPQAEHGSARACEAPQGEAEAELAAIWARLLGVARVGRTDNFFELGGHSLTVLQLQVQVQRQFHTRLPLEACFEAPTLTALAARILASAEREASHDAADMAEMNSLLESLES